MLRLILSNSGSKALSGWTIAFKESAPFSLVNSWGGALTVNGQSVQAKPLSWNETVPAGGSVEVGLQLSYTGVRPVPTAGAATAGGAVSCSVSYR